MKNVILFSHHYVDAFVERQFNNAKRLNPEWDIIPVGFPGYKLLPNSMVVDKSKYPSNERLLDFIKRNCNKKNTDWCDADLFLYEAWFQYPNYDNYFLYEYDTICNVPIEKFFDIKMDFFGNNVYDPASEDWGWAKLYREKNSHHTEYPSLYGWGQATCIYMANHVAKGCYEEIMKNRDWLCGMISDIRGAMLVRQFTSLKSARPDIRDFVWWNHDGLKFRQDEYFYHPIKNFEEMSHAAHGKSISVRICEMMEVNERMININKYAYILHSVLETSSIEGDMIEMGCNEGMTSMVLSLMNSEKKLWVYDSFEGFQDRDVRDGKDGFFVKGALKIEENKLVENFKKHGVDLPIIKKGWFSELTKTDIPQKISFAFLDGDFYDSIKVCLNLIIDNASSGGIILVDDYKHLCLPGVKPAVDGFMSNRIDCTGKPIKIGMYKITKL